MEQFNCKCICVTVYQIHELTRTRDTFVWQGRLFRTSILLIFVFSHFYKLITYHGNLKLTVWRSISVFDARKIVCNHSTVDQDIPCKISLFPLQSFNYKARTHFWLVTWSTSDIETIVTCHVVCLIWQNCIDLFLLVYKYDVIHIHTSNKILLWIYKIYLE